MLEMCDNLINNSGFLGFLLHHNFIKFNDYGIINDIVDYLHARDIPILKLDTLVI